MKLDEQIYEMVRKVEENTAAVIRREYILVLPVAAARDLAGEHLMSGRMVVTRLGDFSGNWSPLVESGDFIEFDGIRGVVRGDARHVYLMSKIDYNRGAWR